MNDDKYYYFSLISDSGYTAGVVTDRHPMDLVISIKEEQNVEVVLLHHEEITKEQYDKMQSLFKSNERPTGPVSPGNPPPYA